MAEVVDAIIAELIARDRGYIATFEKATAAHKAFTASVPSKSGFGEAFSTQEVQQYTDRHKKAGSEIVASEEATTAKVTRTRKVRTDAAKASDEAEVSSAKKAARDKADAEIAEAARSARYRDLAERAVAGRSIPQAKAGRIGATVANERTGQSSIPASVLNGTGAAEEVAVEKEVNHLLADQATLQANLTAAKGADRVAIREQIAEIRLENQLRKAGLADEEILLRIEERRAFVAAESAAVAKRAAGSNAEKFVSGAGLGRTGGGTAAVAGIAVAAGIGVAAESIKSAVEYAKALSDISKEVGISTTALQVYQAAATQAGVSQEQLRTGLGQLSSNLGRAREGAQEQAKVFAALGIDIKGATSAGDLLPTLIDRISSIADPAQRAAVETRLFGEEGRKLDALLSGGNGKINELAAALERTGAILSSSDIAELDNVSKKLEQVNAQLRVTVAETVAHNADAILSLANAFSHLVSQIGGAVSAYNAFANSPLGQRFSAINDFVSNYNPITRGVRAAGSLVDRYAKSSPLSTSDDAIGRQFAGLGGVQAGRVNTGLLNTIGAPKPSAAPKGRSAEQVESDRLERDKRFTSEMEREQTERLNILAELTADTRTQDQYQRDRIEIERVARNRELDDEAAKTISKQKLKGSDAALVNSQRDQLKAANDANAALQDRSINFKEAARFVQDELEAARTSAQIQTDMLDTQSGLARTASERRDIELRRLKIAQDAERSELLAIRSDPSKSPEARTNADVRLKSLDAIQAGQTTATLKGTQGPVEQYLDTLPRTAADIDEAFQKAAVGGLQSLNDGLSTAVDKFLHLHGIAGQFLSDLIKIGIERELTLPVANALFPTAGGASGSASAGTGIIGTIATAAAAIFGHRATGGSVVPGASYLVGERGPEVVRFGGAGTVYPNGVLPNVGAQSQGVGGQIVVHVQANDYFDARVAHVSGPIAQNTSIAVVQAAGPRIARAGAEASSTVSRRVQTLGS